MATIKKQGGTRARKPIAEGSLRPSWSLREGRQTVSLCVDQRSEDGETISHKLEVTAPEAVESAAYVARVLTVDPLKPFHDKDTRTDAEVLRKLADAIEAGTEFA